MALKAADQKSESFAKDVLSEEAHQSVCRRHLDILHQSARLLPLEAAALLSSRWLVC